MRAPTADKRPSLNDLANDLRPILVRLARELRKEALQIGITGGQATFLWQISAHPGIGVGELAELEGIATATASGIVDRLERSGHVSRVRSDSDRRRVGLTITTAGSRLLRALHERRTVWLIQRLETLSAADLAMLEAAVEPLRRVAVRERGVPES